MGIVAAQCRVFIVQNDICAPRPLYYHLFLLDNRRIPASSPPRRLPDSLLFPSISQPFRDPSRLVPPLDPLPELSGGPFCRCFCPTQTFRYRLSSVSCTVPVGFPLAFSMFFGAYWASPQSESEREGRSVPFHIECSMSSLRSPFRFPARWTLRVAFRGVGRGERRGVLWKVSCETWTLPRAFLYAV